MILGNLPIREQIVKTVVKSGNGGAVWVPKNWLGQEVVVILPENPKLKIKEKVIHLLEPYLKDIVSVFIYGSYARHEETKESDIDVMVVTEKPIKISIKEPKLEITTFELEKFKKAIEKHPVMYYQIVQEAEPLINAHVLGYLRNIKIENKNFKDYLNETKEHAKSSKELLELDRLDGKFIKSYSIIYSSILRLRGVFIIRCILNKEDFSNKNFKKWIRRGEVNNDEFEQFYSAYRAVRDNKNIKNIKIRISTAEKLLNILEKELKHIEIKIYGKSQKEASKRN
ncbi:nucleotidyltransferase domain-containing protein [Candidatus Woesearchaeota archaeon]|nr:nucleotidyltransferase domain-containing protein [Candidatus Woesearchaeota archaeon]